MIKLKFNPSPPQYDFWTCNAPYKAMIGGISSGKTFAGAAQILMTPPNTIGFALAPTYPILQNATMKEFKKLLGLAKLSYKEYKGDRLFELPGNRTVIFRNASDPDQLRGPNLHWCWLDEAAMMKAEVFDIMIGRLRLPEYHSLFLTTTPRGKDWIYKLFEQDKNPDFVYFHAPTYTNKYNRAGFTESLRKSYSEEFQLQEIEGDWVDDAYGVLIPSPWLERASTIPRPAGSPGPRVMGVDTSGGTGKDRTAIVILDRYGILKIEASNQWDIPTTALRIRNLAQEFGIPQHLICFDASTGGKGDVLPRHLAQYGITAIGYHGGSSGGDRYRNLRSRQGNRLRMLLDPELPVPLVLPKHGSYSFNPQGIYIPGSKLQPPFTLPPSLLGEYLKPLKEEISALRFLDRQGRFELEDKDKMKARLGRSPDLLDAVLMALTKIPEDQYQRV